MKNIKTYFIWLFVFLVPIAICLFFSITLSNQIYKYIRLNKKTYGQIIKMDIKNYKNKRFYVIVYYDFSANGKTYSNKKTIATFLNGYSARSYIEKTKRKTVEVWYNKKKPKISSLKKELPIKNLVYFIISFGVFLYFIILRYYLSRIQGD